MTIDELINRVSDEIIVENEFRKKIEAGKKLRIKMGFDPTKPDLHLGHLVGLRLLKKLQEDGHTIIFIIGDYTAKIGDPSGRNLERPVLSTEEIKKNAETYFSQVERVLDLDKTEVKANSEWFDKLKPDDILEIMSKFTLAQISERDDFAKRIKAGNDIGLHEMLYPVMQAYDSVMVKADVEIGGTDQKFNMLSGRSLQKKMGGNPQDIITVKLLVGLDGKNKMSKSLGNYIALNDAPEDMYGKIMSIPDELIVEYFTLCTDVEEKAIDIIKEELMDNSKNPRDKKAELAKLVTEMYWGDEKAEKAEKEFYRVHRDRETPEVIEEKIINSQELRLDDLVVTLGLATSKSEARRLIEQGGVEVADNKITDPTEKIKIIDKMVVRAGKRNFVKVKKPAN